MSAIAANETVSLRYPNVFDYAGYVAFHLVCLAAFRTGVTWTDLALCAVLYFIRMFGLMAGYHRYFAHRAFRTSRAVQFLLALLGTLGVQKGVLWWASTHRHHHRYSDTELDLHSPIHRSFLYSHSGWFLDRKNRSTDVSRVPDLVRYPELVWLDRWDLVPITIFGFLIWLFFGWSGLIWGFFISTVLIWHGIHAIGSFGHRFGGYRRFATTDNSRNKWFLAIVLLGEGWHNNHHFYPGSARHGFVWWEYDVTYWLLRVMERFGLVWDLRVLPEHLRLADDAHAQAQVRTFEQWLMDLRVALAQRLAEATPSLQQSVEMRLDAFGQRAIDQIVRNPEELRGSVDELRRDLAFDAAVEAELMSRVRNCSFAHFMAGREV